MRRQRRRAARVRSRRAASSCGEKPRHDPEVLAGARRRQALRRHREHGRRGKFYILKPHADKARDPRRGLARHADRSPRRSSRRRPSRAAASTSRRWTRCTRSGRRARRPRARPSPRRRRPPAARAGDRPATLLGHADRADPEARRGGRADRARFDAKGNALPKPGAGDVDARESEGHGRRTARSRRTRRQAAQAGLVKATVGALTGAARIRVIPDLPWTFDFEDGRRRAAAAVDQRHRQVRGARCSTAARCS